MNEVNIKQTPINDLNIKSYNEEVQEQFWDYINNVPFIKTLIAPDRPYAKDLPKDEFGRVIVDIEHPHILEDMEYFRPSARHYEEFGCYTKLRPNPNPNSEYGKWVREEVRRCYEGYVRPSDGEWITGDYYFWLNYCPMLIAKKDKKKNKSDRVLAFPRVWEGHYLRTHYIEQARSNGHHCAELASRSKGKSYGGAAMLAKRFVLGESYDVNKKVTCYATASEKKYLVAGDQTLDKFQFDIDWCAQNTQFPSIRLTNSLANMQWRMGYKDLDTGTEKGTLNAVIGVTSKDDEAKLRGSRGVLYILEEWGSFPRLISLYNNLRPSVEDGNDVFGLIYAYGTAGDNQSDFAAAQEIMYNPRGYNMHPLKNVFDKEGQGRPEFVFFFPGYLNRADCYDDDGNSDVTKALLEILQDRYTVKHNSSDATTITKRVAEIPITPQEAILKTHGSIFPVTALNQRINEIDNNPSEYDDVYVGNILLNKDGVTSFVPTSDTPIRDFPLRDNKAEGAIEIYKMPEKDSRGEVYNGRYIAGLDPIDDDVANTMSLMSLIVLDLWTDKIVCEWTGRLSYAEDCYERVRLILLFYNARCLYENNKKGIFSYFSQRNCLYLLAETPEYLRDRDLIKGVLYGNKARGFNASLPLNNYANQLIRNWLIKPVTFDKQEPEESTIITVPNLSFIRNRALLKELVLFNPVINVDRVRALGALMLYREEKMILYQGDFSQASKKIDEDDLSDDPFFTKNYKQHNIHRLSTI